MSSGQSCYYDRGGLRLWNSLGIQFYSLQGNNNPSAPHRTSMFITNLTYAGVAIWLAILANTSYHPAPDPIRLARPLIGFRLVLRSLLVWAGARRRTVADSRFEHQALPRSRTHIWQFANDRLVLWSSRLIILLQLRTVSLCREQIRPWGNRIWRWRSRTTLPDGTSSPPTRTRIGDGHGKRRARWHACAGPSE